MEYRFHEDTAPVFWSDIGRICPVSVSRFKRLFFLVFTVHLRLTRNEH